MASSMASTTTTTTVLSAKELASNLVFLNSSTIFRNTHSFHQLSSFFSLRSKKANHLLRASSQGTPSELDEESKFVPLDAEEPSYGPPSLLLVGFKVEEAEAIQQLLKNLDGEFLQVIYCTEDMITGSLWDAVNCKQQNLGTIKIAKSVPRICFLSGLTGEEMMMFIDAFEETGLEHAVFAAHVPNSSDKSLQELIDEVMGDHEMLSAKQLDSK